MAFPVKRDPGDPPAALFNGPEVSSGVITGMVPGEIVEIDDLAEQEANDPVLSQTWLKVRYLQGTQPAQEGWTKRIHVDLGSVVQPEFPPMTEARIETFVFECAEAERLTREQSEIDAGNDRPAVILADYLIALGLAETGLSEMGTQLPGTDAVGPFQITNVEWQDFLGSTGGADYRPEQRFEMIAQIDGAAFLTQRDWRNMVDLAKAKRAAAGEAEDDQYVPSFLNLYHARLLGPEAALAVNDANSDEETKNDALETVLAEVLEAAVLTDLKERRARSVTATPPLTVNGFFNNTSKLLREKLKNAFSLFKKYDHPFAELPKSSGQTPWMDKAEAERVLWEPPSSLTETSPEGIDKIVNNYFKATNYATDTVAPWCGAFTAWCLANSGDTAAAASVFPGAARAANWKTWGTTEIRPGSIKSLGANQIFGAIVVLHPGTGTGSSGHVCFALSRTDDKLECVGGNQSDRVRKSSYRIDRVAAMRVLQKPATKAVSDGDITQATVDLIKGFEGLRLDAYQDSVDVWTIGYGTTTAAGVGITVVSGMTITQAEAENYLTKGLEKFAAEMKPAITAAYSSNQFGAMLSLAYNIGTPRFKTSTCVKRFNAGDIPGAAEALTWWNKAGGKVLPGLVTRRAKEKDYFLNG